MMEFGLGQLTNAIKYNFADSALILWYLHAQVSGIWGMFILAISILGYKLEVPARNICEGNYNFLVHNLKIIF